MSGYEADLDAIGAAAGTLRETVDAVSAAADHLDGGVCASLGPGRLGQVAAALTEDARDDVGRVQALIVDDAELAEAARSRYAGTDQAAAEALTRRVEGG